MYTIYYHSYIKDAKHQHKKHQTSPYTRLLVSWPIAFWSSQFVYGNNRPLTLRSRYIHGFNKVVRRTDTNTSANEMPVRFARSYIQHTRTSKWTSTEVRAALH